VSSFSKISRELSSPCSATHLRIDYQTYSYIHSLSHLQRVLRAEVAAALLLRREVHARQRPPQLRHAALVRRLVGLEPPLRFVFVSWAGRRVCQLGGAACLSVGQGGVFGVWRVAYLRWSRLVGGRRPHRICAMARHIVIVWTVATELTIVWTVATELTIVWTVATELTIVWAVATELTITARPLALGRRNHSRRHRHNRHRYAMRLIRPRQDSRHADGSRHAAQPSVLAI
jgi:hypothetical protein